MPAIKDLLSYSDEDINKIITEDFRASEDDRAAKNEQNWQANQMFHCRDLITSKNMGLDNKIGSRVLEARAPLWDLNAPLPNKSYIPWLRGVVLTALAKLSNALWPDFNDFFRLDPMHPDDEESTEQALEAVKYFIRGSHYSREGVLVVLQALKYDFGILYTGWKKEFGYVPGKLAQYEQMRDFATGEWSPTSRLEQVKQRYEWRRGGVSGWDVFAVNTFNFRHDPRADHMDFTNCEWAGMTFEMSKRRMHELVESGKWPESILKKIADDEPINDGDGEDNTQDYVNRIKRDEKLAGDESTEPRQDTFYVRVRQYNTQNAGVFQINGKHIVRPKTMGSEPGRVIGWPYHKVTFMPEEGMFSGTSLVRPLMPIQHDLNFMHRLIRDAQDKAVNADRIIDGSLFNSVEEAEAQPWGTGADIILTRNPSGKDVRSAVSYVAHPGNQAPDMWNSIAAEMQGGERASGISANLQSTGLSGDRSATEVAQIAEGAESRSSFTEKQAEIDLVVGPIERLLKLIHLNVSDEIHIRISGTDGAKWRKIVPGDLIFNASPDVVPLGMSSMQSRQAGYQALRDAIINISANPIFGQYLKVVPSLRALFRSIDYDPDEFVNDENMEAAAKMAQHLENVLMASGVDVPINPLDNHREHLKDLTEFVHSDSFEAVPDQNRQLFLTHAEAHRNVMAMGDRGPMGMASLPAGQTVAQAGPQMQPGGPQQQAAAAPATGNNGAPPMPQPVTQSASPGVQP